MTYPPPPGTPDPYNQPGNSDQQPTQPAQDPYSPPAPTPPTPDPYNQPTNPYAQPPTPPPSSAPPTPPPSSSPPASPYGQPASPYGQPYGQQASPYGQPYAQQPYGAPQPQQNSMALISMILSLVGIVSCITAPVGAILGHMAMRQIQQTGESGEGMAKTGIIVGWIVTALYLLCTVGYVIFFVALAGAGGAFSEF